MIRNFVFFRPGVSYNTNSSTLTVNNSNSLVLNAPDSPGQSDADSLALDMSSSDTRWRRHLLERARSLSPTSNASNSNASAASLVRGELFPDAAIESEELGVDSSETSLNPDRQRLEGMGGLHLDSSSEDSGKEEGLKPSLSSTTLCPDCEDGTEICPDLDFLTDFESAAEDTDLDNLGTYI